MARVAKETGKHLATGHQRHYNILYDNAVDQIQRGMLGDLHYIRAQWHRGNLPGTDSWQQPLPNKAKPDDAQKDRLDKELMSWKKKLDSLKSSGQVAEIEAWEQKVRQKTAQISDEQLVGQVEQYGYEAATINTPDGDYNRPAMEELIRWRLWDRTGGGLMAELGSHQLDAASIFISAMFGGKKQHPLSVSAAANRSVFPVDRDANDHVFCILEFAAPGYDPTDPIAARKKIGVQYASINGNGFGGYGEIVFGEQGTLLIEREQEAILLQSASKSKIAVAKGPTMDTQASGPPQKAAAAGPAVDVSRGYTEEEEHWAWCIRNNPNNKDPNLQPRCHPKVALGDAVIALTANIAAKEGRRIVFDEEWFDPESDATPEGVKPDTSRDLYKS